MPVEPGTSETLTVTSYWNTAVPACQEIAENAYVTVSWSGSAWVLSNITTSPNITGLSICSTGNECGSPPAHAYDYRLIAQVNDPLPGSYNLRAVEFATTVIDDGRVLDPSACTLGAAVSPTSQSFSVTDFGVFECGLSCGNSGASMTILYR
jgi:hypothetical protein